MPVTDIGIKNDEEKARWDLIPPDAMEEVARVMTHGAVKYKDRNWELGIRFGRMLAAAHRHLNQWERRQEIDGDSGLPHLAHAVVNLLMILALQKRGAEYLDDRSVAFKKTGEMP